MAPQYPARDVTEHVIWRPTKVMNQEDLSRDDDYLSHILVEKLGTGSVPLYVHKMDSNSRFPRVDAEEILKIVQRRVISQGTMPNSVRYAVSELLHLPAVRHFCRDYEQKQINAFATHASRYFELYHTNGCIEIAHTSRYAHKTGKSELCILATRPLTVGTVITELKGSMANLSDEQDKELKRAGLQNGDIRRDFSVIHSRSMKKNHLFLGPARFVNHDCNNNCELFREGKYITFRVLRPISTGEEVTAHYGDCYFGRKNKHCLCETCEKNGRGGYAPDHDDDEEEDTNSSAASDDSESETEEPRSDPESKVPLNVNERRTRRGVYAVVTQEESDDSDEEDEDNAGHTKGHSNPGGIELAAEVDTNSNSELTTPTPVPLDPRPSRESITPALVEPLGRFSSSLSSISSAEEISARSNTSTPFRSIISTRRQKARSTDATSEKATPPVATEGTSRRVTRSISSVDVKGKGKATGSVTPSASTAKGSLKPSKEVKKEEVEGRLLRARPSVASTPAEVAKLPLKPDPPRGADGKVLPTCVTCNNILPIISIGSQVVWGLGFENGKKKKKQECPRCLRHFAIYNIPWPRRVLPNGQSSWNSSATPRDLTPIDLNKRLTPKTLPVLDRKLAVAASNNKRPRQEDSQETVPAPKRKKVEPPPPPQLTIKLKAPPTDRNKSTSARSTRANNVASSPKEQTRRSNRLSTSEEQASPSDSLQETPESASAKRKRGRPRLSDQLLNSVAVVKVEDISELPKKAVMSQPRNTNGRFGRKDTFLKAQQRAARAANATKDEGSIDSSSSRKTDLPKPTRSSPRKKRENEDPISVDESPKKKASIDTTMDVDDGDVPPLQRMLPRARSFKGATLFSKPNPLKFALQAWASPVIGDDTSSEDEGLDTPEDDQSPPATTIADPIQDNRYFPLTAPVLPRANLTYKPSPFAFAKRRWASSSLSPSTGSTSESDPKEKSSDILPDRPPIPGRTGLKSLHLHEVNSDVTSTPRSPMSDSYPSGSCSEDEVAMELVHVYPVVSKPHHQFAKKPMQFCSHAYASSSKPSFIHVGWDNASDISDT